MIEYRRQEENNYPKAYAISTGIMLALLVPAVLNLIQVPEE
jgi:hypothetical protein